MTVLSDAQILDRCRYDELVVPFNSDDIQPASIDLRLGNVFHVFEANSVSSIELGPNGIRFNGQQQDSLTKRVERSDTEHFVLHPGEFCLGCTKERVKIPLDLVGRLEGKSSLGRLGLVIHCTAGFFDCGYEGVPTLEMANLLRVPVVLRPGLPVCQMSFSRMDSIPIAGYSGRYQGDNETTPQ